LVASLPDPLKPTPAGRHRLPREVREEHQRARVLTAALDVFAEKGYPATTVDDLVAAAKTSVGSFYSFFNGKEECLLAAHREVVDAVRQAMTAAAEPAASWPEQVCLGLRELLGWVEAEPAGAKVALVEIQTGGPTALGQYEETLADAAEFLRRGRELFETPRRLPESLEQTTVSGIAWLLHRRLTSGEEGSVPALFEELGVLILEPYLGESGAKEAAADKALASNG
jgi:AcrR family transcriptional regulator